MDCTSELKNLVAASCENPAVAGTFGEVILLPYNGIDRAQSEVENGVIKSIVMKTGKKGCLFDAYDNSPLGAVSLVAGTYRNNWQHDATLRVFTKSTEAKEFVNGLTNSRVVVVLKNKEGATGGEVTYEAYGWDAGLVLTEATGDTTLADGVVYELVLGSDETSKEKTVQKSVFDTSIATTETMLKTLYTAGE